MRNEKYQVHWCIMTFMKVRGNWKNGTEAHIVMGQKGLETKSKVKGKTWRRTKKK